MKTLNLKLTGSQNLGDALVFVDDKPAQFKRNEFKDLTCSVETDSDKVNLKIYKALDVGGIWWFLTQLFFFLISIFGILDIYSKNRYLSLQYEGEVELKEDNNITLSCNLPRENAKVFDIETDLQVTENENKFYIDQQAKKKFKILLISKILLAIAIVVTTVVVLIVK